MSEVTIESLKAKIEQRAVPSETTTIEVSFQSGLVETVAPIYTRFFNQRGHEFGFSTDVATVKKYMNYLLMLRIKQVNGEKIPSSQRFLYIPSVFALALRQVGPTHDYGLGIRTLPVFDTDLIETMSDDEANEFSLSIAILQENGVTLVKGLPREREGDPEFMLIQYVSDEGDGGIGSQRMGYHDNSVHPVKVFLAAHFAMSQISSIFKPRINYGLVEDYHQMLGGLLYG